MHTANGNRGLRQTHHYVSEANLTEPDTALGRALGECVTETIYSIELEPPEGGGTVKVTYPFIFSRDEPDDSTDAR